MDVQDCISSQSLIQPVIGLKTKGRFFYVRSEPCIFESKEDEANGKTKLVKLKEIP